MIYAVYHYFDSYFICIIPWGPWAALLIWALFLATNKFVGEQYEDLEYM